MSYTINYTQYHSIFAVPTQVTDHCLSSCSGMALKVLLLVLRHPEELASPASLAQSLSYPVGDVKEALDYWVEHGLLAQQQAQASALPASPPKSSACEETLPGNPAAISAEKVREVANATAKKNMPIAEIEALSHTDPRIHDLLDALQSVMGRPLGRSEMETILSFYTYSALPPEYILLVTAHCVSINRTNMRAISKTLNDMIAEGIDTYDKAESYINRWSQRGSHENQVKSAFGIYDRSLTSQEKKFIDSWFTTFGYDISMIKLAYERTIDTIGKLAFAYVNSILASWHSKGITTTKEAAEESSSKSLSSAKSAGQASSIDMNELQHFITYGKTENPK